MPSEIHNDLPPVDLAKYIDKFWTVEHSMQLAHQEAIKKLYSKNHSTAKSNIKFKRLQADIAQFNQVDEDQFIEQLLTKYPQLNK